MAAYTRAPASTTKSLNKDLVVIITLPKENGFDGPHPNPKAISAFLCTDSSLDTVTILEYYSERWCIETFFEQQKGQLGFNKYQIRTMKGIERFWLIMSLHHLICCIGLGSAMPFGDGQRLLRRSI
ncbi:MAG: transposase, partial [Clostridiales bacterium]|nr:transposase [Clostridiales bacterium]